MAGSDDKRRQVAIILLAILFFLGNDGWKATAGHCQPVPSDYPALTLDGPWKIRQGDSPEFSDPAYQDADWQTVTVPSNAAKLFPGQDGYIWYRKWLYLPPGKPAYDLGIRLGKIASADESFVNGYRLGGNDSTEPDGLDYKKIRIYPIPDQILAADGVNLVAVRVKPFYPNAAGLYSEAVRVDEYSKLERQLVREENAFLICSSIFILIGFSFLVFFVKRRSERDLLFFSMGAFCIGLYTFYESQWPYILGRETVYDFRLAYVAGFSVAPAFARFIYEYLADRNAPQTGKVERLYRLLTLGMLGYAGIMDAALFIYSDYRFWYYLYEVVNTYLSVFFGGSAILYLLYRLAGGVRNHRLILFASVVAFAGGIAEALKMELRLPDNVSMWGMLTFVLLCTFALANRFFRLQDEVAQYSAGLERMVDIRTRQLKSMEESRRRLLANISHDLRTPVSSVLGHAELLLEEIVDSPDQQRGYIKRIHAKMLGFNRLIQDLFELAKIESQQERFHMVPVPALVVVENVYQKYLYDVQNAGIAFENRCSLTLSVQVLADEDRLDQVFANLISNALRYTPAGGLIAIGCQLTDKPPDGLAPTTNGTLGWICFTVADDGSGIVPEEAFRIFERFYRGNEAVRTNPSEHSGLGLAIAREIILAHGGRIWADAAVEQGCTIHFVLPVIE